MSLSRRQFLKRGTLAVGSLAMADGFGYEPRRLRVLEIDRRDLALGKTIVHFSDVHHNGDHRYLARVVDTINAQRPDLVLFTGDMVNGSKSEHLGNALEHCGRIQAPLYGVAGNHDPWDAPSTATFRRGFAATGGKWLHHEALDLDGFTLHATTAWRRAPVIGPALPAARKRILLCHYPAVCEHPVERPYDLILSGHSHGGQVRVPLLGPLYLPSGTGKYVLGNYDTPLGKLFVSAGVGTTGLRLRFLCPPDIAVIRT
jgi:hypothetical protein